MKEFVLSDDLEYKYFKCYRCGDCCKTSDIPITIFDFLRIKKLQESKTKKLIEDFSLAYHPIPENPTIEGDMIGVIWIFRKKPCKFFRELPEPTCIIYENRPSVCENTPNPMAPPSIGGMIDSCNGLQNSNAFPFKNKKYYIELSNLHVLMLGLTARFFYDALGLGSYLNECDSSFSESVDQIISPEGNKNTREVIKILDNSIGMTLNAPKMKKDIIVALKTNISTLLENIDEINQKTLSITSLKEKYNSETLDSII